MDSSILVIKKDGQKQPFDAEKICAAITKSAERVMVKLHPKDYDAVCGYVVSHIPDDWQEIDIAEMHNIVECALDELDPRVAKS